LKRIRVRLGLTTRNVADLSRSVAVDRHSDEYLISHSRLVQIENDNSIPSVFKLFTLSSIYGTPVNVLLGSYIDLQASVRLHRGMDLASTHPTAVDEGVAFLSAPAARLKNGDGLSETNLLTNMAGVHPQIPVALLEHLRTPRCRYAFIGLSDMTMYPLIRPGSFIQVDESQKLVRPVRYQTEYDRPLYFIELRSRYLCSWCEVENGKLLSIPHPLSPCRPQQFAFPMEAEIIGRVTGVALRLLEVPAKESRAQNEEHLRCAAAGGESGDSLTSIGARPPVPLRA
jgi:transcriptional regulator with XRE-family HTH domain